MDDSASKIKGLGWVVFACFLATLFVFGLSPFARAIPWSWENKLADTLYSSSKQEYINDTQIQIILQKIVRRIYPLNSDDKAFKIDVHIVRNKEINAHAELGGKILINSGLISQAESPEEIAGILAHEIEHVHHRDILIGLITYVFTAEGIKMIFSGNYSFATDVTNYLFNMNFNRSQESSADKGALLRLQQSHIDNQGFKHFFISMEKNNSSSIFLSDHPSNRARLEMAGNFNNQNVQPILTADEWKNFKRRVKFLEHKNNGQAG
jgi:predicted Zn-dependent protease